VVPKIFANISTCQHDAYIFATQTEESLDTVDMKNDAYFLNLKVDEWNTDISHSISHKITQKIKSAPRKIT